MKKSKQPTILKRDRVSPEVRAEQPRLETGTFGQKYDEPLTKKMYGARFPLSYAEKLDSLTNQAEFIRQAVIRAIDTDEEQEHESN